MRIDVVTPPAVEPVTLAQIWDWLNLTPTDSPQRTLFDAKLASMIAAAREECEATCNRAFVHQTLKLTLARFPRLAFAYFGGGYIMDHSTWPRTDGAHRRRVIELPRAPLISVTSIQYYDLSNTLQTVDPADYYVIKGNMPAQLQPANDSWPDTFLREDAVQITYVAGYEGSGSPADLTNGVPAGIVQAIKLTVEKNFNPMDKDQQAQLENAIACALAKHRVYTF